jgi:hypothetical protein
VDLIRRGRAGRGDVRIGEGLEKDSVKSKVGGLYLRHSRYHDSSSTEKEINFGRI